MTPLLATTPVGLRCRAALIARRARAAGDEGTGAVAASRQSAAIARPENASQRRSAETPLRRRQHAFTLLELMVSVAILALIIVGLLAMFNQVSRAFRAGTAQVDVMEGGRAAMGLITRELSEMTATPLTDGANFHGVLATPWPSSTQPLAIGGFRTNELWNLSFVTHLNDEWIGIGYRVSNAVSGVGTLYRLVATADAGNYSKDREGPTNIIRLSTNLVNSSPSVDLDPSLPFVAQFAKTNYHRVIDGVVHLMITAYETNGTTIESRLGIDPAVLEKVVLGAGGSFQGYACSNSILPAYIDVELGVLEPAATAKFNQRVESNPGNPAVALDYLSKNVGKVHLFRQRVPIRSAATSLGPGT
jgi:prepilin-type N-terminal cleavage/methylation domain-containing protein